MNVSLPGLVLSICLLTLGAPTQAGNPRQQALELYTELIAIRTAKGFGNVPKMAELLRLRFVAAGFPAADIHIVKVGETAALVVRYRGDGSGGAPVLFMAHMDVVDALRKDWSRDPYTLIEEDGHFYGRGTSDNKAGVVALTQTFIRLKGEGFVPTKDLIIVFSGDEETSGDSIRELLQNHREWVDAQFALNSDGGGGTMSADGLPQSFDLQAAEKTYATFELTVRNPGGHSSRPRPDNAIYELSLALQKLSRWHFPVRRNDITQAYFSQSAAAVGGDVGAAMRRFAADPSDQDALETLRNTHYVGMTTTTCVATMLRAGHAENALPQSATATVNCRIFPGVSIDEVQQTLRAVVNNTHLEISLLGEAFMTSPPSPLREDVLASIGNAVHRVYGNIPIIPSMAPYYTDGRDTRRAGIPTYGVGGLFYGPGDGNAHGLNERVSVDSFYQALEYWYILVREIGESL